MDLDLHGVVSVRVPEPMPDDLARLAPFATRLDGPPDVTVGPGPTVEWGGTALPGGMARPAIHAASLLTGAFPLHATAVVVEGMGVAVTGWSRSGKTGALLTLLDQGGRLVAAEWSFVADGRLLPLPDAVRIRGYAAPGVGRSRRARSAALGALARRTGRWPSVARRLDDRRAVDVEPTAWGPTAEGPVPLDVLAFLVGGAAGPVREVDRDDAIARLSAGLRHDLAPLRAAHDEAIVRTGPHAHPVMDRLDDLISDRARDAVQGVRTVLVPTPTRGDVAGLVQWLSTGRR